ncbi:hypothetical protein [Halopiger goleimassiliensis]|uniref:hypothetical protein n=1 Tax=Halopiger goleimassiliensis TaxID=1293048 RepID=UPI000677B338|nr:hypothetical protein [Halopiger goleimassiliensis]
MNAAGLEDRRNVADPERRRSARMLIGHVPDCAYRKWNDRAPAEIEIGVIEAWYDADPIHYPNAANNAVVRFDQPSKMSSLACQGALMNCYPLSNRSRVEQQYTRSQLDR